MNSRFLNVILDLQYGSTGKGLIAGFLAERDEPDTIVTAWAANAGHTYINADGRKFVHTMLANGIVSPNIKCVLIGPGSVLNLDALASEIEACIDIIDSRQIIIAIHENAAVITAEHVEWEAGPMTKIGSTKKGVGEAMIQRIRRDPDRLNTAKALVKAHIGLQSLPNVFVVNDEKYGKMLDRARVIQVEGAQGHSLSMYHGFYPYTTSRDVSTAQLFADCGIPVGWMAYSNVVGCCRTFPIRVANRYNDKGHQVGFSGPNFDDQKEVTFAEIDQPQELTTVTKLPRRIFTFSEKQVAQAIRQNSVDQIFLNFANYTRTVQELDDIIAKITRSGGKICYVGLGPKSSDIEDVSTWHKLRQAQETRY